MPIWDMLPNDPACSFIGYVTAPELGAIKFRSRGASADVTAIESRISDFINEPPGCSGPEQQAKEKEMRRLFQKLVVKAAEKAREASRAIEATEMEHMRAVKQMIDQMEEQLQVKEETMIDRMEEERRVK